ncbi:MAG: hypothetical protein HQK58_01950 [Deltaproteobacteria bacterium]|nr:hypothetical protein [Deltaproteobacteria bacterium]
MLKSLAIDNLTVFPKALFSFSPQLNVVVGENGTGKSHLLKAAYSVLAVSAEEGRKPNAFPPTKTLLQTRLAEKLVAVLRPETLGRLARRKQGRERCEMNFVFNEPVQSVCGGAKAVDILAFAPDSCIWLIEVKDYREHPRTKPGALALEVAKKVRDSLAAIFSARMNADDPDEKEQAGVALESRSIRVVLHLEQPARHSKLFPRAIDPANVQQELTQLIKAIDAHPKVLEQGRLQGSAWTVWMRVMVKGGSYS